MSVSVDTVGEGPIAVVSLSFYRFARLRDRAWALAMMGGARRGLAATPGIGFWKLCGSGAGVGFDPVPNTAVYAILATWDDLAAARAATAEGAVFARYRRRAAESWSVYLSPQTARGRWSGRAPFMPASTVRPGGGRPQTGPLAVLTRASLRPSRALAFWRRVPGISRVIGADPAVIFRIGIGEVPWLHQVTFSIWPDAASMSAFAHRDGAHARAVAAVRRGDWFREELYARFAVLGTAGTWGGACPLERHITERPAA